MSTRMDRAGRKNLMKIILRMQWRKDENKSMTVGQIAKKMGMKSSTALKNMLKEMVINDDEILYDSRSKFFAVKFRPYVQQRFEERHITINGERQPVAAWVRDFVAAQL